MSERKKIYLCLAHMSEAGLEQKYINEVTGGNPSVIYNQPIEYVVTDREGSMIPIIESIPHYPTNGNNVAIRGFYPSTAISSDGTFTTKTNQVSSVGYQGSDLMYSSLIGRNTEGVLNLTFTLIPQHFDLTLFISS